MGQSKQNYGLEVLLYPYRFNEEKTRHRQTEGCTDTQFWLDEKIYDREKSYHVVTNFQGMMYKNKGTNELIGVEEMGSKCAL